MILNHISWQQYLKGVAILVAAYYLVLFLRCRRGSGRVPAAAQGGKASSGRFIEPAKNRPENVLLTSAEEDVRWSASWDHYHFSQPILDEVNSLIKRIKAVIVYGASAQCDERYMSDTLQTAIQQYPGLKDDIFRRAVKRLIQTELALYELPPLSEREMNNIWIEDINPAPMDEWPQ